MTTRRIRTGMQIGLLFLVPLLAGCEPEDKDLLVSFAKEWGRQHGMYDENGNLTGKALGRGASQNLPDWMKPDLRDPDGNVDPAGNAMVDAGAIIKNMKDTDALVDQANADLTADPPRTGEAMKKLNSAVLARPNDWYYRNRRAMLHLQAGNTAAAEADFLAAQEGCGGNQRCLNAADKDRARLESAVGP